MTENTPTAAELVDALRNGGTEDRVEIAEREARAADLIEQLAAAAEHAPHEPPCRGAGHSGWPNYLPVQCTCRKSIAPANLLAQVKADAWAEGMDEGYDSGMSRAATAARNPYRIERDAQR